MPTALQSLYSQLRERGGKQDGYLVLFRIFADAVSVGTSNYHYQTEL